MKGLFDLYVAALDDGNSEQMLEFYYNATACIIPPCTDRMGWCSNSKLQLNFTLKLKNSVHLQWGCMFFTLIVI